MNKTQIADITGVNRSTIHRWYKAGTLHSNLAKRGFALQGDVLQKVDNQTKTKTKRSPDPTLEVQCDSCGQPNQINL